MLGIQGMQQENTIPSFRDLAFNCSGYARARTRTHTHHTHMRLEELELVWLEDYLTKPTSLSRWNPNSLYTNYEME